MRLTNISAQGLLSFDNFELTLDRRLTVVVGPNGSGKSNLGRLVELARRAIESADRTSPALDQMLDTFLSGRRANLPSEGITVRVGFELTNQFEHEVFVSYLRAAAVSALVGKQTNADVTVIEEWAERQMTPARLQSLFRGEIVVTHRGTADAGWLVGYEFDVPTRGRKSKKYQWVLRGPMADALIAKEDLRLSSPFGQQLGDRLRGRPVQSGKAPTAPGGVFAISRLLPRSRQNVYCSLDLGRNPPFQAARRFAELIGVGPTGGPESNHHFGFARVIATVLRHGLIQTSDLRLVPTQSFSWSTPAQQLRSGAEGNLAEMLLLMKNAPASERQQFDGVQERFWDFTNGRQLDVAARTVTSEVDDQTTPSVRLAPQVLVSVDPAEAGERGPIAQVPIEFAGAGAWEAFVLASVLGAQPDAVVTLDEPAVALSPTMQRRVLNHLQASDAQFVVVTHSPYLVPLAGRRDDVRIVRFERLKGSTTHPWPVEPSLLNKLARKLREKGNEGVLFAWRVVLCEGDTDVEAVRALAENLELDLDFYNISVLDCGGRDNQPDYVSLVDSLGIPFLVVMDADGTKAAENSGVHKKAQAVRNAVAKSKIGKLVEFPEDLETSLGVTKQRPSIAAPKLLEMVFDDACPSEIVLLRDQLQLLTTE